MKRLILGVCVLSLLWMAGCSCAHEWEDATCTAPKTCVHCGETEGEALEHRYRAATCTEPYVCVECGATWLEPNGHVWQEASYSAPKMCVNCGETEGEPLNPLADMDGVVRFGGHAYKVFNEPMEWKYAQLECEILGGYTAVPQSEEENQFLASLLEESGTKNCYWLGLLKSSDSWVGCKDGAEQTYFNWAPNEPNNELGEETYIHMFGVEYTGGNGVKEIGQWNDTSDEGAAYASEFYDLENFGYICEWDFE